MNKRPARLRVQSSLVLLLISSGLSAQEVPVRNWDVPVGELGKLGDSSIGLPAPFSAISPPCRLYDSRISSGGPGPIPASGTRAFDFIPGGSPACGTLPSISVLALSLYITVVNPLGPGFIYAFPTGNVPATPTSIINYNGTPGELRNNAAILAVSGGGSFTIGTGGAGTDIIIDMNGIFYSLLETPDFFQIAGSRAGGIITATNFGTAAGTFGLSALIGSGAGAGSAAVYGTAIGNAPATVYGGRFESDSRVTDSAAVLANSTATSGRVYGLLANNNSPTAGSAAVEANSNASTGEVYGLLANSVSTTTGSAAVYANSNASSGVVYGLLADNDSATDRSAGVWGRSGSNNLPATGILATFGVVGTSDNSGNYLNIGVWGFARGSGEAMGVYGSNGYAGGALGWGNSGVHANGDITAFGAKSFIEPHPTDPAMEIAYVSLEGNEAGTYFRGKAKFQNGLARIAVPEDFRLVSESDGLSIQVTPIGQMASFAVVRIDLDEIVVQGSRNVEFFYTVNGVRKGHGDFRPIRKNEYFRPASAEDEMRLWPPEVRSKLVANGTLTPDGKPNLETAEKLGWKALWEKQAAEAKAAAQAREREAAKGGIR